MKSSSNNHERGQERPLSLQTESKSREENKMEPCVLETVGFRRSEGAAEGIALEMSVGARLCRVRNGREPLKTCKRGNGDQARSDF